MDKYLLRFYYTYNIHTFREFSFIMSMSGSRDSKKKYKTPKPLTYSKLQKSLSEVMTGESTKFKKFKVDENKYVGFKYSGGISLQQPDFRLQDALREGRTIVDISLSVKTTQSNLGRAWDAVIPIAAKYGVISIICPDLQDDTQQSNGKDVKIQFELPDRTDVAELEAMLQDMHVALEANGIAAGARQSEGLMFFPGSNYAAYEVSVSHKTQGYERNTLFDTIHANPSTQDWSRIFKTIDELSRTSMHLLKQNI